MVKVKYDNNQRIFITLPKGSKEGMYMDGYLQQNLDKAKEIIKEDWDMIFLYDGFEGSGKSTKAMQDAYYCDPTFHIERICFTPKEFRQTIIKAKPYQSVVYDEAYTGLSSRATMSLINRTLVSMLAEIRQKNLFVFIVMPTFFDLDRYCALWRSRILIHVYTENYKRGYFCFYNAERKKDLYIRGKKLYDYKKPGPNFRGRFTSHYTIDETEYRKRKKNSLNQRENKRADEEAKKEIENELFERVMLMDEKTIKKIPHSLKMQMLNMPSSTYFWKMKQYKDMKDL